MPNPLLKKAKEILIENIKTCADDLGVDLQRYLNVVSRWGENSSLTKDLVPLLKLPLSELLSLFFEEEVTPAKWNVICKNPHNSCSVPFHQDICYSPSYPYQFSAWLALDDVDEQSGPLVVRKGSHKGPLQPAVDFWSPCYVPSDASSTKVPVKKGDLILFDSRLWHGSLPSSKKTDRYAFVSRWSCQSYIPPKNIPEIQKMPFGMWTCQERTQKILTQGSQVLNQKPPKDFTDLLGAWKDYLQFSSVPFTLPFREEALLSLDHLKILNLAHARHDGGDASGTLYKNLWKSLLQEVQAYIKRSEGQGD